MFQSNDWITDYKSGHIFVVARNVSELNISVIYHYYKSKIIEMTLRAKP